MLRSLRSLVVLSVLVVLVIVGAGSAAAAPIRVEGSASPLIYLSWGAPYGRPGAHGNQRVGRDSTRTDTLYMSFDPVDDAGGFVGLTAVLYLWPQVGDSLGAFWHFERDQENPLSCRFDFDVAPYEAISAWKASGVGFPKYEHTTNGGRLSVIYAVPSTEQKKLKGGSIYCLARVFISHRRARLGGHTRPMCIEWGDANFAVTPMNDVNVRDGAGNPRVSWNSPGGQVCEGFGKSRGAAALPDTSRGWKGVVPPGSVPPAIGTPGALPPLKPPGKP
ncbi:MAG: hypothetical protein HYR74_03440 [Candidatus Eisenbacteria bacterium]|nr:hypothetical protein [Candidatus Eisenbacteria bacterium]